VKRLATAIEKAYADKDCMKVFGPEGGCSEERRKHPKTRDMCYAACRTIRWLPDRHIHDLQEHIVVNLNYYCRTLDTTLDRIFMSEPLGFPVSKKFESYFIYRYLMGITTPNYPNTRMIRVIANGIVSALIRKVETPYNPLRLLFPQLEKKLDRFPTINKTFEVEFNSVCDYHTKEDAVDVYTDALMKDTAMEATLIPGYFFASTVSRYLRSKASFRLKAAMEIVRYMTGSVAGFGCQEFGGAIHKQYEDTGTSTTPEPCAESDSEEACAAKLNSTAAADTDTSRIHSSTPFTGLCDELGNHYTLGFPVPPILGDGEHYTGITGDNC